MSQNHPQYWAFYEDKGWDLCCIKRTTAYSWQKRVKNRGGLSFNGVGLHQKRHKFGPEDTQELLNEQRRIEERNRKRENFQKHIDALENAGQEITVSALMHRTGLSQHTIYKRLQLCGRKWYRDRTIALITESMKFARLRMARQQLVLMARKQLLPEKIWFSDECRIELTGSKVMFSDFSPFSAFLSDFSPFSAFFRRQITKILF